MVRRIALILLLQAISLKGYAQWETYYHKIEQVAYNAKSPTQLYNRIDSIKKTRRPNDSKVKIYFNRDVDFGYKHQRINVTFNGVNLYEVNMLIKNDSIKFCSVLYSSLLMDNQADKLNSKQNHPKIDTIEVLKYLDLRNKFYSSSKTINDLKDELNLNITYAFYCGDGNPKTKAGEQIEELVKNKQINVLKKLLDNICCEQQAYAVAGIKMLQKNKTRIPSNIIKISSYINKRNSEVVTCEGCFELVRNIGINN